MIEGNRFSQALDLALELHRDDTRKRPEIPYMGHLLGVTAIVTDDGVSEGVLAELFHDGLEDARSEGALFRIQYEL